MSANPLDRDFQAAYSRHEGSRARADRTRGEVGPDVQAEDSLHTGSFERASLNHGFATGSAFFGGLEQQFYSSRNLVFELYK